MATTRKAAAPKATTAKRTTKAAKKAAPQRGPVTPDAEITKWIKAQLVKADKAGAKATTSGLLREWRAGGGKANPRRFAALVNAAR